MKNRLATISWFSLLILLIGCTAGTSGTETASEPVPAPTTFPFFEPGDEVVNKTGLAENSTAVATVASLFSPFETPMPRLTLTPWSTLEPFRATFKQSDVFMATIFEDELSSDWEILDGTGAVIDTSSNLRVFEGERSIAFTPEVDYSTLFFTVKPGAEIVYRANDVFGVSFWINGGDDSIHLDQMAVSVIGSNDTSHWVADDDSVDFPEGEGFSETRFYFLNLNRSIPPETWVEVYVQLDTLIYDPYYENVVGFYLKNDEGFRNTVYVDNVNLVMVKGAGERMLATTGISAASEATPAGNSIPEGAVDGTPSPTERSPQEGELDGTPTPTATPESVACVVSPPAAWELHRIQAGDTISGLAVKGGTSINFALDVNCLEADDVVSVGQGIWLPALSSSEEVFPPPGE